MQLMELLQFHGTQHFLLLTTMVMWMSHVVLVPELLVADVLHLRVQLVTQIAVVQIVRLTMVAVKVPAGSI